MSTCDKTERVLFGDDKTIPRLTGPGVHQIRGGLTREFCLLEGRMAEGWDFAARCHHLQRLPESMSGELALGSRNEFVLPRYAAQGCDS